MEAVFLKLLNMSITAGWIVLAVVLLRLLLKKAPKWISCLLWVLVGIRLVLPFSFESKVSVVPSTETVPQEIIYSEAPVINSGVPFVNNAVNPVIGESLAPEVGASVNPIQIVIFIASIIWCIGIAGMLIYALVSYLRIKHKVRVSAPIRDNIYICDNIGTPFILGVFKPKIYLPSDIGEQEAEYIIAHEKSHLKRRDHLWKPLGFALLTVYWFNPLLWLGYVLLCRDIELACDERVIKDMGAEEKKAYSTALLNCSIPRRMISACPLAFGEVGVKSRIKSVLNYKKPAFWIIIVAIIACIVAAVCLLTDPKNEENTDNSSVSSADMSETGSEFEGISIRIKSSDFSEDMPYIEIEWTNTTDRAAIYGEPFALYRKSGNEWIDCSIVDAVFNAVGYAIPPHDIVKKKYYLSNQDMSEAGVYRFETYFLLYGDTLNEQGNIPTYNTWVSFELEEPIALQNVSDYEAVSVVYASDLLSSPADLGVGTDYRAVSVAGGIALYRLNTFAEYDYLGHMTKTQLTEDNFDSMFFSGWKSSSLNARMMRTGNNQAWIVNNEDNGLHILMQQKDGTAYLVCGHLSEDSPDMAYVTRVYRLEVPENNEDITPIFGESDSTIYTYPDSIDFMAPSITLYDNGEFQFIFSGLSSYIAWGSYKLTEYTLILPTSDGMYVYVFDVVDDTLVFDADRSSDIPKFRYSADSYETQSPVPDGAVFYRVVSHEKVGETSAANEPLSLTKLSIPKTADWKTLGLTSAGLGGVTIGKSIECSYGTLYLLEDGTVSGLFRNLFFALEKDDNIFLYNVIQQGFPEELYCCDIDGEAGDEIVFSVCTGVDMGGGSHISYIFKITDNGFVKLFEDNGYNAPFDTGFEYKLQSPFKLSVTNSITGYSTTLDFSDKKGYYSDLIYDETGEPIGDKDANLRSCFTEFVPKDIDGDGVYEVDCSSYTSLYSSVDYIGDSKCTIKYDKKTKEFKVVGARFVLSDETDVTQFTEMMTLTKDSIPNTSDWKTIGLTSAGLGGAEFYSSHECSFGTLHILTHHSWSQAFVEIFFALERKDDVLLYAVTEFAYPEDIYFCDVDGEKGDEIVFMTNDGGNGGAGSHTSYVFKITDNGFKTLFDVNTYVTPFNTGFEYEFQAPFKMLVKNTITGYSTVIDYSNNKGYIDSVYDEKGNPLGEWIPSRDCFYKFVPTDIDGDGVYEITCTSYTHLYGHADWIGDSECTIKYDKETGEFKVVDARFIPKFYEMNYTNSAYSCVVRDINGNVLLEYNDLRPEPEIKMVNDSLISVSVQAGTGRSTCYTVYCNVYTGEISHTYWSVLAEHENKVVYADYENGQHSIVVQDIFDENVFYKKVIISEVFVAADPVIDIQLSSDGIATVTYVKGENYTETEIKIDLTKE